MKSRIENIFVVEIVMNEIVLVNFNCRCMKVKFILMVIGCVIVVVFKV